MPTFRAYIDKKIDPETGMGGDHSRIIDVTEDSAEKAKESLKLNKSEELNQIVELWDGTVTPDDLEHLRRQNEELKQKVLLLGGEL